ncbi:MAG: hypothetical protein KDC95_08635, partial [Planctomycetes bacterium]|nr:hypothetical protein [Planctomycetota bacterium]
KAIAVRIGRVRWAALTLRHAVDETLRKQASDALVASLDDPDSRVRVVLHKELFRTPVDGEAARHAFGRVTRWLVDPATSPARIRQLREHLRSRMRAKAADAAQRARRTEQSPKPLRAGDRRLIGNESAAIATLKNVALGQAQVQASGVIDIDGDGKGEFGFFGEMSGALPIRESTLGSTDAAPKRIIPPVLSGAFCAVTDHGSVQRSGYWYRMYLPSESGVPTDEATMLDGTRIDPERAEHSWCAFAWPIERGRSGIGCFAVDVMGAVWRTNDRFGDFDGEWTLDVVANSMLVAPKPDGFCPSGMHWKRIQ